MMTKKHFAMIAKSIDNTARLFSGSVEALEALESLAKSIAADLAAENPNFNRQRFLEAAGAEDYLELPVANVREL